MEKPTEAECEEAKCDTKKFHCIRKSKFGLNLQAMCDSKRRFLFCSIGFPGSCSDHSAWENTEFKRLVEKEGFLAVGLCIFGDNAYINSTYLATPFTNASGDKDDYNFFHSQLRINIECAFGMLTSRFGILRKALPWNYGLPKIKELVRCLCSLHNFLIDNKEDKVPTCTAADQVDLVMTGAITVNAAPRIELGGERVAIPDPLLDCCNHHLDHVRPRRAPVGVRRDYLHEIVVEGDWHRPVPVMD